jgi:hypothetical protein
LCQIFHPLYFLFDKVSVFVLIVLAESVLLDFALFFALNYNQLSQILIDVLPALRDKGKLWIAYPKPTSKIVSDLNRDCNWDCLCQKGFLKIDEVVIDHVWTALRFCTASEPGSCEEISFDQLNADATVKDIPSRSRISSVALS